MLQYIKRQLYKKIVEQQRLDEEREREYRRIKTPKKDADTRRNTTG